MSEKVVVKHARLAPGTEPFTAVYTTRQQMLRRRRQNPFNSLPLLMAQHGERSSLTGPIR
eukprot:4851695-Pleurochrysis_carterae.AAC.2